MKRSGHLWEEFQARLIEYGRAVEAGGNFDLDRVLDAAHDFAEEQAREATEELRGQIMKAVERA